MSEVVLLGPAGHMDYDLCNNGKTLQDEALKPENLPITRNRTVTFHLRHIKIFPTSFAATFDVSKLSENKGLVQRLSADVVEFWASMRYGENLIWFVSSVGRTTQLGPVGVRKDVPAGPLDIRPRGLIWNQRQLLADLEEGMFKKRGRKSLGPPL